MLSSSDAKSRCLWLLFIWSLLIMLITLYYDMKDFMFVFLLAALTVIFLPIFTAVYCNSSKKHGATLLRIGYIVGDPILACLMITPVQLFSRLSKIFEEFSCLDQHLNANKTNECIESISLMKNVVFPNNTQEFNDKLYLQEKMLEIYRVEVSITVPMILYMMIGRRTKIMEWDTFLNILFYWFIVVIEASTLLEFAVENHIYKNVIICCEISVAVGMIFLNSFLMITFCKFLTKRKSGNVAETRRMNKIYRGFVTIGGILFAEIPFAITRMKIIQNMDMKETLIFFSFYLWLSKDFLFIFILVIIAFYSDMIELYQKLFSLNCGKPFDNFDTVFLPEKRDIYIHKKRTKVNIQRENFVTQSVKNALSHFEVDDIVFKNSPTSKLSSDSKIYGNDHETLSDLQSVTDSKKVTFAPLNES